MDAIFIPSLRFCRGRVRDNIFVERPWRTVKREEVYLHDYCSVSEARSPGAVMADVRKALAGLHLDTGFAVSLGPPSGPGF